MTSPGSFILPQADPGGASVLDLLGRQAAITADDPAFQPPGDPFADLGAARNRARLITREVPNVTVQTGWDVQDIRSAVVDLVVGLFDRPAQLQDAIAADSRVQSAMRSRSGGLLGRDIRFRPPDRFADNPDAKKCCRIFERHWEQMGAEPALLDLLETSHSLGFSYAQILWDTSGKRWLPYLQSFNARYSYYHWLLRAHIAVHQDGQSAISPGDGHWVLHAPYGQYRGWMRGALRALAQWWLARSYALRDWARYSERHGFPIIIVDTPFGADPNDIDQIQVSVAQLGQESVIQVPGSVDVTKYGRYDLRYLEPSDQNWQAFKALIEQCNDEITLALLGQNLTSQVKEGSFAAARVHADVRQAILEADARALARTIYVQVARPFAALNFGNADLAPRIRWNVAPPEDLKTKAQTMMSAAQAMNFMRLAGFKVKKPQRLMRQFGIRIGPVEHVDPLQVEARLAGSTGVVNESDESNESGDTESRSEVSRVAAFGRSLAELRERAAA